MAKSDKINTNEAAYQISMTLEGLRGLTALIDNQYQGGALEAEALLPLLRDVIMKSVDKAEANHD